MVDQFCSWIEQLALDDTPAYIHERAKYLMLDGLGCAIVAAHLAWTLNMKTREIVRCGDTIQYVLGCLLCTL